MFFLNPIILVLLIFVLIIPNVYHECINLLWLMWKKWGISYLFKNVQQNRNETANKVYLIPGAYSGGGGKRGTCPPPNLKRREKRGKKRKRWKKNGVWFLNAPLPHTMNVLYYFDMDPTFFVYFFYIEFYFLFMKCWKKKLWFFLLFWLIFFVIFPLFFPWFFASRILIIIWRLEKNPV